MDFSIEMDGFDDCSIVPCRTCGIYFAMAQDIDQDQAMVKPIFSLETTKEALMSQVLQQMLAWNLEVNRDDGRPQHMCVSCIAEFKKILKFKQNCLETQEQFGELEIRRKENSIIIKKEVDASPEEGKFCGFIYVDEDDEEIGSSEEDGSRRVCAAFDIPHVPIKEEHMARVPTAVITPKFQPPEPEEVLPAAELNENESDEEETMRYTYKVTLSEPSVCCQLCGQEFLNQAQHLEHMSRIHLLKDYECHICSKKFLNAPESRIKYHMKWHKLQRHLKCPICGFFCTSKDILKEHKLAVHTKAKCKFCGKKMKQKMLESHLNEHLQERQAELALKLSSTTNSATPPIAPSFTPTPIVNCIRCAFCEDTFENAQQLQAHVLATHKIPQRPQTPPTTMIVETEEMPQLEQTQTPDTSIQSHNSSLNQSQKSYFYCPICGKPFDLKIKLNRHLKQHTKAPF